MFKIEYRPVLVLLRLVKFLDRTHGNVFVLELQSIFGIKNFMNHNLMSDERDR